MAVDKKDGENRFSDLTKNDECSSLKEIVYEAKKWNQQNQFDLESSSKY